MSYSPPWNLYVLLSTSLELPSLSTSDHLCMMLLAHTVISAGCGDGVSVCVCVCVCVCECECVSVCVCVCVCVYV